PTRRAAVAGELAGLTLSPLPASTPVVTCGQYVQGALTADPGFSRPGQPFWRALGTLTRSAVDTWLFVVFDYLQALDLHDAACLAVDVQLPPQATATQLLVILHERDGGDYLAASGRSLSEPGAARLYVPLHAFRLMGQSKDPNGRLDLDQITAIRIGWGGYFGQEGEQVGFSLAAPRLAVREGR
ncbi:MAG: hypothetical protein HUU35_18590, partial [Armatimonadetes bacterium]|nr:hypothetical protein [Armatimonadota bacterium]